MKGARTVTIYTPAKVNFTLEALGKRDDGYHQIASVMQTIGLFDALALSAAEDVRLISDVPELRTRENLVYRAACLLREKAGDSKGAEIKLLKNIPVAAGLGGGSSDAAATLLALNLLWELGLDVRELKDMASLLGSDVPFFLSGGSALAEGRGERITPIPSPPTAWLILVFQPNVLDNKTATAYKALTPMDYTDGQKTARLAGLLRSGASLDRGSIFNVFDSVAARLFPGIGGAWEILEALSGAPVHLSGAGPTLFCLVESREEGEKVARECSAKGLDCMLVRTLAPGEGPRIVSDG